jgi:hypothetical protein
MPSLSRRSAVSSATPLVASPRSAMIQPVGRVPTRPDSAPRRGRPCRGGAAGKGPAVPDSGTPQHLHPPRAQQGDHADDNPDQRMTAALGERHDRDDRRGQRSGRPVDAACRPDPQPRPDHPCRDGWQRVAQLVEVQQGSGPAEQAEPAIHGPHDRVEVLRRRLAGQLEPVPPHPTGEALVHEHTHGPADRAPRARHA